MKVYIFTLLLTALCISCSYRASNPVFMLEGSNDHLDSNVFNHLEEPNSQNQFGLVILHGAGMGERDDDGNDRHELSETAKRIAAYFGEGLVQIICPRNRAGEVSLTKSIDEQVQLVYESISSELISVNLRAPLPLFIIGYSQGGMVAARFVEQYGDKLNIKGYVMMNSPLGGVPVLGHAGHIAPFVNNQEVKKIFTKQHKDSPATIGLNAVRRMLPLLTFTLRCGKSNAGAIPNTFHYGLLKASSCLTAMNYASVSGCTDMIPGSPAVQNVHTFLSKATNQDKEAAIPGLIIGGYHENLSSILDQADDLSSADATQIDIQYAQYITKENPRNNGALSLHDTLIPLTSQLCIDISGLDLANIPDQGPLKRKVYSDTIHTHCLPALMNTLAIKRARYLPEDPDCINDLVEFIKQHQSKA